MNAPNSCARISVAMATYNGEKYIREQLDSIARQKMLPVELVITDDGSTDATLEIVEDFARDAPFAVRTFRNESRLGYADNFLKAASLCLENLIAFCDQDDVWVQEKLSTCAKFFDDPVVSLAIHSGHVISTSSLNSFYPQFKTTEILDHCNPFAHSMPGFAMVVRKELCALAKSHERPERLYSHDRWLWFLAASTGKIATIADVLTLYRHHDTNAYGAPQPRSFFQRLNNFPCAQVLCERAEFELACSRILIAAAENFPDWTSRLIQSARKLELRADLLRIRMRIYTQELTLWHRGRAFVRLCFMGGYRPNHADNLLGLVAAIRDLLFGIPGLDRLFSASVDSTPS